MDSDPYPQPVERPDFSKVIRQAENSLQRIKEEGYSDEDDRQYIWEAVMIAIYGPDVFKWINKQLR